MKAPPQKKEGKYATNGSFRQVQKASMKVYTSPQGAEQTVPWSSGGY